MIEEWIAAGIYDPAAADAADRLELLHYLESRDIPLDEMVTRQAAGTLTRAAVDALLRPDRTLSVDDAAVRSGLTPAQIQRAWLAFGLPTASADSTHFDAAEVRLLASLARGGELLGPDAILQFARVMGQSLARLAEAAVFGFLVNIEQPMIEQGDAPVVRARSSTEALEALLRVPDVFAPLFRRHLESVIERQRASQGTDAFDVFRLAVGFLDLVGYTEWTESVPMAVQGAAMADFERTTSDAIAARGGRVVKNIGDAVMFVVTDQAAAYEIARELCAAVSAHDVLPALRGAVGYGDLLGRDGDYFGPMVNLVARAVAEAPAGGVVVTEPVEGFTCVELAPVQLRGFDAPTILYQLDLL